MGYTSDNDPYEEEVEQIQQEIRDECEEYAENWQRAEDDGWFYSDEDGDNWYA